MWNGRDDNTKMGIKEKAFEIVDYTEHMLQGNNFYVFLIPFMRATLHAISCS